MSISSLQENVFGIISNNLKELRIKNNLSLTAVASVLGITRQAYSTYEAGNCLISIVSLIKLAQFYNTSLDSLVTVPNVSFTSSDLSFFMFKESSSGIEKSAVPFIISNDMGDKIVLKQKNGNLEIYETCMNIINGSKMLFEFDDKYYTSIIHTMEDESVLFKIGDKPFRLPKKESNRLLPVGLLIATTTFVDEQSL